MIGITLVLENSLNMPLTQADKAKMDAILGSSNTQNRQQVNAMPSVQQANSSLSSSDRARMDSIMGVNHDQPVQQNQPSGLFGSLAGLVNKGVQGFANLPGVKQVGEVTGAAMAIPAAIIGGTAAAIGTPIANIAKGKPVFQDFGQNIKQNAIDTGKFGYSLGEQVPTLGVMQTLGRVPNTIIGASQTYQGVKDVKEALARGDKAAAVEAGINVGIGAAGTLLGAREGGNFLNENVTNPIKAKIKGTTVPEMTLANAEKEMRDVLQPNKSTVKRETKGILNQSRQERAGIPMSNPPQPVERTLVQEGVIPSTKTEAGTVKFDTRDQVIQMDQRVNQANDILEKGLQQADPNPKFSLSQLRDQAVSSVDNLKNISATERKAMKAEVSQHFNDEIASRGDMVNGADLNQVKRGMTSTGDYKNLSPGQKHIRAAASILQKAIEKGYEGIFDVGAVNRIIGDYIGARDTLLNLDGVVLKGGGLGRRLAAMTGAIAGRALSKIPVIGELVGYKVGEILNDSALSPDRRLSGKYNVLDRSGYVAPQEGTLSKAQNDALTAEEMRRNRKLLPAPKEPIVLPYKDTSGALSQAEAVQNLRNKGWKGPLTAEEMRRGKSKRFPKPRTAK